MALGMPIEHTVGILAFWYPKNVQKGILKNAHDVI
jgi:hypothetical protein